MNIYKINNDKLESIKSESFKLEKDIQALIEKNCDEIFNLQFVKSEFTIQDYRIDSLCFNQEDKSFVVIEYKKGNSYSVIDQGYTYLSQMLNNKSDFVLEYNESTNSNLKRDDVDWTQSRVIFVSPSFNSYQKDSVNFKDIPFELWQINKYADGIVSLNQISSKSKASIKSVKNIVQEKNKVLDEVEVFDEEFLINKSSDFVKDIYELVKENISHWNDITFIPARLYIRIVKGKKTIAYLNFKKTKIHVDIARRVSWTGDIENTPIVFDMNDPKGIFKIYSDSRREIYRYTLEDDKDFDYLISIMKQRYDAYD
jgi:hypothetical protein